jgi:hypothetical protein
LRAPSPPPPSRVLCDSVPPLPSYAVPDPTLSALLLVCRRSQMPCSCRGAHSPTGRPGRRAPLRGACRPCRTWRSGMCCACCA